LLATRAIDDPEVATFLACWLHEETFHGLALARFLAAAGYRVDPRPAGRSHRGGPAPRGREPGAPPETHRIRRHRAPVPGVAGLLRGAHDVGRHQRAAHGDRLSPARRGGREG